MLSSIRKHVTYANVAATLALVFAMGGSAVAASHYLINSTRQIRPSVLRYLHGRNGANGLNGRSGINGKNGISGANGKNGAAAGYYARQGSTPIYITGNTQSNPATIAQKFLPAGNFLVSSTVQVDMSASAAGGYASVTCTLLDGSSSQQATFTSALGTRVGGFGASGEMPLQIAVGSPYGASTVTLNCVTPSGSSSGASLSTDAVNATISAVQASTLG
jgi:hypothetical protein